MNIEHSRQKVSMFIHLIFTALIYLMYLGWNLSPSLVEQTFRFTSQSMVHESDDWRSQHGLLEKRRGPACKDSLLGLIAKMAPIYENRKENKQSLMEEMTFGGDDKHELCQLPPLKSPPALVTGRSCVVSDWAFGRSQSHPGGHEPAVINKPPAKHVRAQFVPAV